MCFLSQTVSTAVWMLCATDSLWLPRLFLELSKLNAT
jgi:hypothetical protein